MKQITIRLDESLIATIDMLAQKRGISRADYIRMAIIHYVRKDREGTP